jgi:hypothetical protein
MSGALVLERRYRRLLALYPRRFRREHGDEMLAVLLAGAGDRRRPGLAESADLLRNAALLRLRPGVPRSERMLYTAVRLMYAGAAMELLVAVTLLFTIGDIHSAIVRLDPALTTAQWHSIVRSHVVPHEVSAPIAAVLWVWLAWANGRGLRWARLASVAFVAALTLDLLVSLAQGAAVVAPVSMGLSGLLWLTAIATLALLYQPRTGAYGAPRPVQG